MIYLVKHERLWLGNRLFCFMNNLVVNRAFTLNTGRISFNFKFIFQHFLDLLQPVSRKIFQFLSEKYSVGFLLSLGAILERKWPVCYYKV